MTENVWRHAMVPWKEGGRAYTYLLPPDLPAEIGDTAMVEGPKGNAFCFPIVDIVPHTPTTFQCKPVCNVFSAELWAEMKQAEQTEKPTVSMDERYPEWKAEAANMFVEGR